MIINIAVSFPLSLLEKFRQNTEKKVCLSTVKNSVYERLSSFKHVGRFIHLHK